VTSAATAHRRHEVVLAPGLVLPDDVAAQKFAFLGISGSGKSYGASKLAEELWAATQQFAVFDTVGNWYGLRLAADGKKLGIPITILGGDHGDVAISHEDGALVARTLVDTGQSIIIDISDFTQSETRKFVIDFTTTLLTAKKKAPSPLMIFWEECQDIVPQKVFGEDARMVGAVQKLIKKGRNYGVGTTLISQRPAAVNKEALNQCHTLFGFRSIGKLDRKAIEDWISDHGTEAPTLAMSKLPTGTCMLWSPEWLKLHETITIGKKWTFDASATPDFSSTRGAARELAPIDLEQFRASMGAAIAEAEEARKNSPEELLRRIRELENQIVSGEERLGVDARANQDLTEARGRIHELEMEKAGLEDRVALLCEKASVVEGSFGEAADAIAELARIANLGAPVPPPRPTFVERHEARGRTLGPSPTSAAMPPRETARQLHPSGPYPMPTVIKAPKGVDGMTAPTRAFLIVLAQRGPQTRKQAMFFADYRHGGSVTEAFATMLREGWAVNEGDKLAITPSGLKKLGPFEPLPTGDRLYESVMKTNDLNAPAKSFMGVLRAIHPASAGRKDIMARAGYKHGGSVTEAFAMLIRYGYFVKDGRDLRMNDNLFSYPKRKV